MSAVRDTANKMYKICKQCKGKDEEQNQWLFGFLTCAIMTGEITEEEVQKALKRL